MKHFLLLMLLLTVFFGCKKNDKKYTESPELKNGAILAIFKVDSRTNEFEGGKVFTFPSATFVGDSIPISYKYFINNNAGSISLYYIPTKDSIFDGQILWTSDGRINFPTLDNPALYSAQDYTSPPDSGTVQQICWTAPNYNPIDIPAIWSGVKLLDVVQQLTILKARVGLFSYLPLATAAGEQERQWFWVMYANNPA